MRFNLEDACYSFFQVLVHKHREEECLLFRRLHCRCLVWGWRGLLFALALGTRFWHIWKSPGRDPWLHTTLRSRDRTGPMWSIPLPISRSWSCIVPGSTQLRWSHPQTLSDELSWNRSKAVLQQKDPARIVTVSPDTHWSVLVQSYRAPTKRSDLDFDRFGYLQTIPDLNNHLPLLPVYSHPSSNPH